MRDQKPLDVVGAAAMFLVPSALISIEMARPERLRESPSAQEQRATAKGFHDMEDLHRNKSAQKVGLTNGSPVQTHTLRRMQQDAELTQALESG